MKCVFSTKICQWITNDMRSKQHFTPFHTNLLHIFKVKLVLLWISQLLLQRSFLVKRLFIKISKKHFDVFQQSFLKVDFVTSHVTMRKQCWTHTAASFSLFRMKSIASQPQVKEQPSSNGANRQNLTIRSASLPDRKTTLWWGYLTYVDDVALLSKLCKSFLSTTSSLRPL